MPGIDVIPPELSQLTALLLVLASFFTSAVSATFGLGGGVAMLIALLSVVPPVLAIPLHAVIQIGSNTGRAYYLREHIMFELLPWFIPGSIIGVMIASLVFVSLPTHFLQLILAVFILYSVWVPRMHAIRISERAYFPVGIVGSFATMFLGATGPFLATFLSPTRYGRDRTVATHAMCMSIQHSIKLIAFGFLGFVFRQWLVFLIAMISSGLLGTWMGGGLLRQIPESMFRVLFKSVLTVLALRLLYKALTALV